MALAKCFERTRSGEVDRGEEDAVATEVLLDSTFAGFPCRRAGLTGLRTDDFVAGLATFFDAVLEALFGDGFARLAFK